MIFDLSEAIAALHGEINSLQDEMNERMKNLPTFEKRDIEYKQRIARARIKMLMSKIEIKRDDLRFLKAIAA